MAPARLAYGDSETSYLLVCRETGHMVFWQFHLDNYGVNRDLAR